jgi:IS30 family transposase
MKADKNTKKPRVKAFEAMKHQPLLDYIMLHMKTERRADSWSPEMIDDVLRRDFPDDTRMRICHETLYQFIYSS